MAVQHNGFTDALQQSRLASLNGTTYPAAIVVPFLGLFTGGLPLSDGSGGTEATGTRPSITFGAPTQDGSGRWYIANSSAINNIQLANTSAGAIVGFGIFAAATGGTVQYVGTLYPNQVSANATISLPVGAICIFAETPS